jgi:hypothetical protein
MNKRSVLIVAISLGMILPGIVLAGSKKKATPPPIIKQPTIAAVTTDSVTVKDDKGAKTLTISQFTEINVNGRKATVADLKPGMTVNVTLGTDASKASRINATSK